MRHVEGDRSVHVYCESSSSLKMFVVFAVDSVVADNVLVLLLLIMIMLLLLLLMMILLLLLLCRNHIQSIYINLFLVNINIVFKSRTYI